MGRSLKSWTSPDREPSMVVLDSCVLKYCNFRLLPVYFQGPVRYDLYLC